MGNETEAAEDTVQQRAEAREAYERAQLVDGERQAAQEARMRKSTRRKQARAQKHMDGILERTTLRYVRLGRVKEAWIPTNLDRRTLRAQVDYVDAGDCGVLDFPEEGLDLLKQAFGTGSHPRNLEAFRAEGPVYCPQHGEDHEAVLAFKGLELREIGLDPCSCINGDPHRFRNISNALLNLANWKVPPGEAFDCPDGGEETLAKFVAAGMVRDTQASEEPVEETPEKSEKNLLDAAVETWEEVLESRRKGVTDDARETGA